MDLLAEVGPEQLSIRELSQRSRANSGQVYHYFGSKDALLQVAMRRLQEDHQRHMEGREAMGLVEDERYWRALGHAVLDRADHLFRLEIEADRSAPLAYINEKRAESKQELDATQSAYVLANIALTLGWATFEPFLLALIGEGVANPPSREDLRQNIAELLAARMATPPKDTAEPRPAAKPKAPAKAKTASTRAKTKTKAKAKPRKRSSARG